MAKPELGTKRECPECAAKYYDLGRSPCICPKCSASFEPDVEPPARVIKAVKPVTKVEKDSSKTTAEADTVSLDELSETEDDSKDDLEDSDEAALADIEIPDEDDDDDDDAETSDVFLDTEDDDETDVSGLLGTDIGKGNDES